MPTVDLYRQRRVGADALPGVRQTAAETPTSTGAGLEIARGQKFEQLAKVGQTITAAGEKLGAEEADRIYYERVKADTLVNLKSANDLETWTATRLHDPKTGALLTKGPATLGQTQQVLDEFDKTSGAIAQGLSTDRQRASFAQVRNSQRLNLQVTLDRHADQEMDRYRGEELQAFVENQRNTAVLNAEDPLRVGAALHTAEDSIKLHAPMLGLSPEAVDALIAKTRTSVHEGVITALLAHEQDKKAAAYFDAAKDEITQGDVRARLEKAIDTATTAQTGLTTAEALWRTLGPKGDTDPINIDKMEDAARAKFADDPKALEATTHFLRERKAAVDAGRKDREEQQLGGLWTKVAAGAGLSELLRDPAYLTAPGRVQAQIRDHVVSQAEHDANRKYLDEGRAYTEQQRTRAALEQKTWSRYWDLSDPKTLDKTNENALQAMRPEIGDEHVNRLLAQKRALTKGDEQVRAAAIDDDLFKTTAAAAGLKPYDGKLDESGKAELGQLKNAVEQAIDVQQREKGKLLTRDEKQKLMQELVDRKVYLSRWLTDPEKIAATVVDADDRKVAYVPLAKINQTKLTQYLNYARSLSPATQRMSDAELKSRYSDRLQRAEAVRLLGGTDADVAAALRGTP
jgi:hypothetical protein